MDDTITGGVDVSWLRVQAVPRSGEPTAGLSAAFNSAFDLLVVEDLATTSRRMLASDLTALGMTGEEAVSAALTPPSAKCWSDWTCLDGFGVLTGLVGSMYDSGANGCARDVYWFVNGDAYPQGVPRGVGRTPRIYPSR